ncbi:hypothetical protein GW17_00031972 [Ensete ventricosum]|nr:hypothetical protein GW17_00031972 [Ensete ventricosum]RZS10590.1 hypothetical protein BHM03_00041831 [Ensete ventricosum]
MFFSSLALRYFDVSTEYYKQISSYLQECTAKISVHCHEPAQHRILNAYSKVPPKPKVSSKRYIVYPFGSTCLVAANGIVHFPLVCLLYFL